MSREQSSAPPPPSPVKIKIVEWDSDSFTIEGKNSQLEEQLSTKITPRILLITDEGDQKLLRNVQITGIEACEYTSKVQTALEPYTILQTIFCYEELL
jgi:hypothetical protein